MENKTVETRTPIQILKDNVLKFVVINNGNIIPGIDDTLPEYVLSTMHYIEDDSQTMIGTREVNYVNLSVFMDCIMISCTCILRYFNTITQKEEQDIAHFHYSIQDINNQEEFKEAINLISQVLSPSVS